MTISGVILIVIRILTAVVVGLFCDGLVHALIEHSELARNILSVSVGMYAVYWVMHV